MASINEQYFLLKDGREVLIRSLNKSDGREMLNLRKQLALDSTNTMHYPEMNLPTVEESSKFQQDQLEHSMNITFGAFLNKNLIGATGLRVPRYGHPWANHVAEFWMGISKTFWGNQLGKKFLEIQENHAKEVGIKRIQASVRTSNERGVQLYINNGFKIEGKLKKTALINEKYCDEYSIAKFLTNDGLRDTNHLLKYELSQAGDPAICDKILRSLPNWFGIESAIVDYVKNSEKFPMITAKKGDINIGFLSLKKHSDFCSEVYVMGVLPAFHRQGVGEALLNEAEKFLAGTGTEFLQVKTLSEDRECSFYKKTRLFYKAYGFKEIEVFPTLWDPANPCQLLLKTI